MIDEIPVGQWFRICSGAGESEMIFGFATGTHAKSVALISCIFYYDTSHDEGTVRELRLAEENPNTTRSMVVTTRATLEALRRVANGGQG